jgi:iron complex transport system ATP-binding protein
VNLFELEHVNYRYGNFPVLDDITFTIAEGEMFGIIGPNGSGKSTLIRIISGLYPPLSGKVLLRSKPLSSISNKELARQIAVLEQEGTPPLPYTVEQVVSMGRYPWLKPFSDLSANDLEIVENILKNLNLWDKRTKKVSALSGGQRQLVSLARAMAQEPRILILDEPTTYLDIGHQILVMEHVRKWHQEQGLTLIMVLHDLNIASQYCDRILLLDQGKIIRSGSTSEVLSQDILAKVYNADLIRVDHPISGVPQFLLSGR